MISVENRRRLTQLASESIAHGIAHGTALAVEPLRWPAELREIRASFVTLHANGDLRGCIGSLEATYPMVEDVSLHAFGAAFRDPRFKAVTAAEHARLEIHISILGLATPLQFENEQELLGLIRPGTDGLVLREGARRATFLPAVWDKLPDPGRFLAQLKLKAGLPANYWSENLSVERYTTESW